VLGGGLAKKRRVIHLPRAHVEGAGGLD
jgi:hypothetical protein